MGFYKKKWNESQIINIYNTDTILSVNFPNISPLSSDINLPNIPSEYKWCEPIPSFYWKLLLKYTKKKKLDKPIHNQLAWSSNSFLRLMTTKLKQGILTATTGAHKLRIVKAL